MAQREGDGVTGWPPGITPAAVDWEAAARRFQAERDAAVKRIAELEAENVRLEALFQSSHGCHPSWVARGRQLEEVLGRVAAWPLPATPASALTAVTEIRAAASVALKGGG